MQIINYSSGGYCGKGVAGKLTVDDSVLRKLLGRTLLSSRKASSNTLLTEAINTYQSVLKDCASVDLGFSALNTSSGSVTQKSKVEIQVSEQANDIEIYLRIINFVGNILPQEVLVFRGRAFVLNTKDTHELFRIVHLSEEKKMEITEDGVIVVEEKRRRNVRIRRT